MDSLLLRSCLVGISVCMLSNLEGATIRWTGAASDFWSDNGNWLGGVHPTNGHDVIFGLSANGQARLDYSLQLGSFTFDTNAAVVAIHIGAGSASTLTLSGAGIINNSPFVSGQNLQ